MIADDTAQSALLDVQAQDAAIARLTHRRGSLPELAKIAELEEKRGQLDGARIEADTEVADLTRQQKKADAEVEQVKTRRARDEERLNSGVITNPKDLESLQHELVALERRISTLEDEELEVMEQVEEAQARLQNITGDLVSLDTDMEHLTGARDAAVIEIDRQLDAARADRQQVLTKVPDDLLALYEKVRAHKGGVGAAALRARRCEGCQLEVNSADLRDLAAAPEGEVLRCPECDRILIRTPESGI
ncbi:MAG: C4-type zinc ribbon domain-containing protein [Aeromicrobium sp.]|uniref:zinc ribbon domain-containing protein n=1 Tax=Aeromicrobium sp. TaxID=1871063 RepID=UPI003C38A62E